jgi:phage gp36-like protein
MATPEATPAVDPEIIDMVDQVRNRYGAHGLRQLIELATAEAEDTESALAALAEAN